MFLHDVLPSAAFADARTFPVPTLELRFRSASAREIPLRRLDDNVTTPVRRKSSAAPAGHVRLCSSGLFLAGGLHRTQPGLATLPKALLHVSFFGEDARETQRAPREGARGTIVPISWQSRGAPVPLGFFSEESANNGLISLGSEKECRRVKRSC